MEPLRLGSLVLVASLLAGCAAKGPVAAPPAVPPTPATEHSLTELPAMVVSPFGDAELAAKFEQGRTLLVAGDYRKAGEIFDQLLRLAPDGQTAAPSLFNSGIAREGLGEPEGALDRYREFVRRYPDNALTRSALVRQERLLAYLERWGDLTKLADQLLARSDLALLETIEAHGSKGLGLIEQDDVDAAFREIDKAKGLVEENRLGEAGKPSIELAEVSFALGEVRRKRSEQIVFSPVPPNFADVLEQRCTGLLDAQNAYSDSMRSLDAHWSAMAGYRVGQLYQQLHRDVMQIPPPEAADTLKKKQLFEGAMRLRYRILLEKGLKMMDATVRLGERTGESSAWVARARDAKRDLERALEDEKSALSKLPFTEAELQAALDGLKTPSTPEPLQKTGPQKPPKKR
jgi:tetratricopeptide (TPR) repeat protein